MTLAEHQSPSVRPVASRTGTASAHLRWHAADRTLLIFDFGQRVRGSVAWVFLLSIAVGCTASPKPVTSDDAALVAALCTWQEHPANPLIQPPDGEWLIGDPTVLRPDESPDGRWHLFANSLLGIYHHVSDDGIAWQRLEPILFELGYVRPFILRDGGAYHLFFEHFLSASDSRIEQITSTDLAAWSTPTIVLTADLPWEQEGMATVGNPFVELRDGTYWLYYSATTVFLADASFNEPRYVGLARSPSLAGPWTKEPQPILRPDAKEPYRNHGAGSFKLLDGGWPDRRIGLENGIYLDAEGHSRSAIFVLQSDDGLAWRQLCPAPIILPHGDGWEKALIYAFDTARVGNELRLYFNARDGWADGVERIGMAHTTLP